MPGRRLGREMGFPTANIALPDERKLLPAPGVYAVRVEVGGETRGGMLNIGVRPTVSSDGVVTREVHIFDFDRQIYGSTVTVRLIARGRGEQKFADISELRSQLLHDKEQVRELLADEK